MLCRNALVPHVITAGPDDTIGDALTLLEQHGIRAIPIVGAGDTLLGWFSFDVVLANLLPGPITVEHHGLEDVNLRLDYLLDGEDSVANRLKTLSTLKLREVMSTSVPAVHPDTPLWEGIRKLFQHGSPVPVVEESNGRLIGLLSVQSVICELAGASSDCAGRR